MAVSAGKKQSKGAIHFNFLDLLAVLCISFFPLFNDFCMIFQKKINLVVAFLQKNLLPLRSF